MFEIAIGIAAVGAGATLIVDGWAFSLKQMFGAAAPDYRLLGRWIGHLARGTLRHENIGKAAPLKGEAAIGWISHYAIGVAFAAALVAVSGAEWLRTPTLCPALLTGLVTVAAPFFVMQPAFGLGIAASRTPTPNRARLRSLMTHLVFGAGLYLSAVLLAVLSSISSN